jgi:light-regulated signal transduction histidine kinase (bacteriophytochrome)
MRLSGQSSSTQRYLTNNFEYVPGPGGSSSSPSSFGRQTYNCEDEPIHIPGAIQRYGALVARVVSDNTKSVIGLETEDLFELRCFTDAMTHNDKKEFVFRCHTLIADPPSRHPDVFQISLTSLRGSPIPLFCAVHVNRESNLIICEFELQQDVFNPTDTVFMPSEKPVHTTEHQATSEESLLSVTNKSKPLHALKIARQTSRPLDSMDMFHVLSEIQVQLGSCMELSDLLDKIVGLVYELTKFHRVMVYRFDQDASGK